MDAAIDDDKVRDVFATLKHLATVIQIKSQTLILKDTLKKFN